MHASKLAIPTTAAVISMFLGAATQAAVEPPKETCSNIKWNAEFIKDYPKAAAECREVTVKDGVKFAKFKGKVSKVSDQLVQVEVSDVADIPTSTVAFQVGVGGTITLNGKTALVKDLKLSDDITFWVREGTFGISPTLEAHPMAIIKPQPMAAN